LNDEGEAMQVEALLDTVVDGEGARGRIAAVLAAYQAGTLDPIAFIQAAYRRLVKLDAVVITLVSEADSLATVAGQAAQFAADPTSLPLFGIPFVIKDNIDLAGVPTTAACPGYTFTPDASAPVVAHLLAAGAVPLAKVNMDQFATGLVGTRSPYGIPANPVLPGTIPGGSSSGSGVAVAAGAALFALGTDTAGSGRVPAAAGNIIGLKPSKGRLSTRGVVPACRTLDCVSIFAESAADAAAVAQVAGVFDGDDPYSRRPVVGQPQRAERLGFVPAAELEIDDPAYGQAYDLVRQFAVAHKLKSIETSYSIFDQAAKLLYGGPWVAERTAAVGDAIASGIDGLDPTVSGIISGGVQANAVSAFQAEYAMADLRRRAEQIWHDIDVLVLPTVPGLPTVEAVAADPVAVNTRLGTFTNFVNLLDCSAVALPVGSRPNLSAGAVAVGSSCHLASVTLVAPAWHEDKLLQLAARLHAELATSVGAGNRPVPTAVPASIESTTPSEVLPIAVVGAHLHGLPLHRQLQDRGAVLARTTTTAACYQLFALPQVVGAPAKPAMIRAAEPGQGAAQPVEVYYMPLSQWGSFIAGIPAPLGIGQVELADGSWVHGFVADPSQLHGAEDITTVGGWRAWLASQG
jgi:allophanate hydrolase